MSSTKRYTCLASFYNPLTGKSTRPGGPVRLTAELAQKFMDAGLIKERGQATPAPLPTPPPEPAAPPAPTTTKDPEPSRDAETVKWLLEASKPALWSRLKDLTDGDPESKWKDSTDEIRGELSTLLLGAPL